MTAGPEVIEDRFLAGLRERVAWHATAAERLRAEAVPELREHDVLDPAILRRLVDASDHARVVEWQAFLAELDELRCSDGRLPAQLERLVRVVLAELLA